MALAAGPERWTAMEGGVPVLAGGESIGGVGVSGATGRRICASLRLHKRGENRPVAVPCAKNDTFVEELEEFAVAIRGGGKPVVGGDYATRSLAVSREGRRVEVAEVMKND